MLESSWTGGLETEFLFPALLQGDLGHSPCSALVSHLQKKVVGRNDLPGPFYLNIVQLVP